MFILQALIHFVVPSGSGQAALTMPIMGPLADLIGVTRQTTVLSFSMADGIGNIIFPTSGYFMAAITLAGIPWVRWAKWVWPLILIQYGIGIIAVIIAHLIKYGPLTPLSLCNTYYYNIKFFMNYPKYSCYQQ